MMAQVFYLNPISKLKIPHNFFGKIDNSGHSGPLCGP